MGYVEGFTNEIQQALIAIAEEQGIGAGAIMPNTWAGANGWNVPDSISDAYAATLAPSKAAPKKRAAAKKATAAKPAEEAAPSDPDPETQE